MLSHQYGGFHQSGVPRKLSTPFFETPMAIVTTGHHFYVGCCMDVTHSNDNLWYFIIAMAAMAGTWDTDDTVENHGHIT